MNIDTDIGLYRRALNSHSSTAIKPENLVRGGGAEDNTARHIRTIPHLREVGGAEGAQHEESPLRDSIEAIRLLLLRDKKGFPTSAIVLGFHRGIEQCRRLLIHPKSEET